MRAPSPALLVAFALVVSCGDDPCYSEFQVTLSVQVVDESGSPLASDEFMSRVESGAIERCYDAHEVECSAVPPEVDSETGWFTLWIAEYTVQKRPLRCEYPVVRISIDLPGCDSADFASPGGKVPKDAGAGAGDIDEQLTITCHSD